MLCAKMWGRQIRPKVELLSSLQSKGEGTESSKDKPLPLSGEMHRAGPPRRAPASPGTDPHWGSHSGTANSLIQDQHVRAGQIQAPPLRFRNANLNVVFSCEHPRQANAASVTSTFTACSEIITLLLPLPRQPNQQLCPTGLFYDHEGLTTNL